MTQLNLFGEVSDVVGKSKYKKVMRFAFTNATIRHLFSYVEKSGDHYLWIGSKNAKGYPTYYHRGLKKNFSARRLIYIYYVGYIPEGAEVLTKCGRIDCVSEDCLYARPISKRPRMKSGKFPFVYIHPTTGEDDG